MSDDPAKNTSEREAKIRSRAYDLWEAAGCPEGREQEFWKQAEAPFAAIAAGMRRPVAPAEEADDAALVTLPPDADRDLHRSRLPF